MKEKELDVVLLKNGKTVTILEAYPKEKYQKPQDAYMIEDDESRGEIIKDDDIVKIVYRS
ncbi:hypothetical protein [Tuberibacillus calidus]|jgi:hypothetical protein|uniref:hypothetical protein n=1 Tax=Tuberibacillus calidus TaxID=340097 RepID=UPI0004298AFF|nr:hypothetical protein [Tuberibacillus calidus]